MPGIIVPPALSGPSLSLDQTWTGNETFSGAGRFKNADPWFDITAYGGNYQQAITDAVNAGGAVFIPPGTITTAPLNVVGNLTVFGVGDSSILKLANSSNGYVFNFQPPGGNTAIQVRFERFAVDGNASNQTSGGCIYAAGSVQSRYYNLHLFNAYDASLWLDQIGSGNIGHHNRVVGCAFDQNRSVSGANQQGLRISGSDENYVAFNDFENWGGLPSTPGSEPYAIKDWSGLQIIVGNVFVAGQEAIRIQDASSTRIIGNTFDGPGRAGVHASGSKNVIAQNLFSDASSASAGAYAQVEIDNSTSAIIIGNAFTVGSTGNVRNCVREFGTSSNKTIVAENVIDISGSLFGGNPAIEMHGAVSKSGSNPGWNPRGPLTAPGIPSSQNALANPFNTDCEVFVTSGTVTALGLGGAPVPAAPTLTQQAAGGSLTAATYAYRVSALSAKGESLAATEATIVVSSGTANQITLQWTHVLNAVSYNVYGRTTGAELKIANVVPAVSALPGSTTISYVDTGSLTPSGALPGADASATSTGMTSGQIRVPAGQTITLTYSSTPTWTWYAD